MLLAVAGPALLARPQKWRSGAVGSPMGEGQSGLQIGEHLEVAGDHGIFGEWDMLSHFAVAR